MDRTKYMRSLWCAKFGEPLHGAEIGAGPRRIEHNEIDVPEIFPEQNSIDRRCVELHIPKPREIGILFGKIDRIRIFLNPDHLLKFSCQRNCEEPDTAVKIEGERACGSADGKFEQLRDQKAIPLKETLCRIKICFAAGGVRDLTRFVE